MLETRVETYVGFQAKRPLLLTVLTEITIYQEILVQLRNIKSDENPSSWSLCCYMWTDLAINIGACLVTFCYGRDSN